MPLDFPSSPSLNQVYSFGGRSWQWNGTGWVALGNQFVRSDPAGITGASAITNIVSLSQASYDAISMPDPTTLYIIVP